MTIKEPQNDSNTNSYDPFSTLDNEKTSNAGSYDPFSILEEGNNATTTVTPLEVEQGEPKIAMAAAVPLEERPGHTSDCPLLKDVPTNQLPLRFQRLLDVHNNTAMESDSVEFLPGFIPSLQPMYVLFAADLIFTFVIIQTFFQSAGSSNVYNLYGLIAALVLTSIVSTVVCIRTYKKRLPLYAKDSQGNQKPFPGDWKAGVYLVGNTGLLEFNPKKNTAWLFPIQSIVSVDNDETRGRHARPITSINIKSSPNGEIYKHDMDQLEEPDKAGLQIEQWYQRCTNGGENA